MFESSVTSLDARVAQGVAFLNNVDPSWWQKVSLLTLDVSLTACCALAQATDSHYAVAVKHLRLTSQQEIDCGFYHSLSGDVIDYEVFQHYQHLTKAWARAIIALEAGTYVGAVSPEYALAA